MPIMDIYPVLRWKLYSIRSSNCTKGDLVKNIALVNGCGEKNPIPNKPIVIEDPGLDVNAT